MLNRRFNIFEKVALFILILSMLFIPLVKYQGQLSASEMLKPQAVQEEHIELYNQPGNTLIAADRGSRIGGQVLQSNILLTSYKG
ncbi:MAG: hypothetical protein V2A78_06445 [bacterium]